MLLKNIKAVLLSNVIIQSVGFISSFILKRLIEPALMGVWNLANIMATYIQMFNFGAASAVQRQMPYYLGRGDLKKEKKVRETYFFVMLAEVFLASAIFMVYFFSTDTFRKNDLWYLFILAPFYALTTRIYYFLVDSIQARQQFVILSRQNIYISMGGVLFTIAGAWFWGIKGLFLGFAVLFIYRIYLSLMAAKSIGLKFSVKFHPEIFKELFKIGIPMMVANYIEGVFLTIDSIMTAKWLGITQLALYALGVAIARQLSDFPTQINTIFYPRIMSKYGKEDDIKSVSGDIFAFFAGTILVIGPFLYLAGAFFVPWIIRNFVSNYSDAILPARILLFAVFFIPPSHILINVFNLKKQFGLIMIFNALALFLTVCGIAFFNIKGPGLWSIAAGTVTGYMVFFIFIFLFSTRGILNGRERGKILIFQFIAVLFTGMVFIGLEKFFPASTFRLRDTSLTALKIGISFVICIPLAVYGFKVSNAWERVKTDTLSALTSARLKIRSFIPDNISPDDQERSL